MLTFLHRPNCKLYLEDLFILKTNRYLRIKFGRFPLFSFICKTQRTQRMTNWIEKIIKERQPQLIMSSYENKKKLLFDCLNNAEQCIKGTSLEQAKSNRNESVNNDGQKRIAKRFHGRESIFKRPAAPISKCLRPRHVPDYQVSAIRIIAFLLFSLVWGNNQHSKSTQNHCPNLQISFVFRRQTRTNGRNIHLTTQTFPTVQMHRLHLHFYRKWNEEKIQRTIKMMHPPWTQMVKLCSRNKTISSRSHRSINQCRCENKLKVPAQTVMRVKVATNQRWKVPKWLCPSMWLARRCRAVRRRRLNWVQVAVAAQHKLATRNQANKIKSHSYSIYSMKNRMRMRMTLKEWTTIEWERYSSDGGRCKCRIQCPWCICRNEWFRFHWKHEKFFCFKLW